MTQYYGQRVVKSMVRYMMECGYGITLSLIYLGGCNLVPLTKGQL
jgi:hypothetical protein